MRIRKANKFLSDCFSYMRSLRPKSENKLGYSLLLYGGKNCMTDLTYSLLYLYRARNKVTQLSIPTHKQLQCH